MVKQGNRSRKANPVSLNSALYPVIENIGLGPNILIETIRRDWKSIVGETNARNTFPLSLDDGILTLAVSSPVWMTQARFYKATFLNKINTVESPNKGEIRDIRFTLERS